MKANYNVTGKERKELVAAIASLTGDKAVYKFMPTCAFEIGDITVDKTGGVTCEDSEKLERLIHNLIADGFKPEELPEEEESADEETTDEEEEAATEADEPTGLSISLPLDKAAVGNLTNLLTAKGSLIKKALGIDDLGIKVSEDKITFPWFTEMPEPATEKEVDNEKYAFRCFLLRLGFIGSDYKTERKILLKNLSGNSSWKNGAPEKEEAACE